MLGSVQPNTYPKIHIEVYWGKSRLFIHLVSHLKAQNQPHHLKSKKKVFSSTLDMSRVSRLRVVGINPEWAPLDKFQ